jgi:hypothetical protein
MCNYTHNTCVTTHIISRNCMTAISIRICSCIVTACGMQRGTGISKGPAASKTLVTIKRLGVLSQEIWLLPKFSFYKWSFPFASIFTGSPFFPFLHLAVTFIRVSRSMLQNILSTLQNVAHFFFRPVKNLKGIKFSVFNKFIISDDTRSFTSHIILKIFAAFSC